MPHKDTFVGFFTTEVQAKEIERLSREGGYLSKSEYLREVILSGTSGDHAEALIDILQRYNMQIIHLKAEVGRLQTELLIKDI